MYNNGCDVCSTVSRCHNVTSTLAPCVQRRGSRQVRSSSSSRHRQLAPTARTSLTRHVAMYTALAMLHASETWPLAKTNMLRLQSNDRAMVRQICSIKPDDTVRSSELLAKLELEDLDLILRERRLRCFGHVERSSGAIRTACDIQIDGRQRAGRAELTWKKLRERDCHEWKLTTVNPQERSTWRSGVRSAMCAASQLPGRGPTDVDDSPAPAH